MKESLSVRNKLAVFFGEKQISPYEFDETYSIKDYLIAYNSNSFSIFDNTGTCVISKELKVKHCNDNAIIVTSKDGLYGCYSYKGDLIFPVKFDSFDIFDCGIRVSKDDLRGFYSYDGKCIVPVEFHGISLHDKRIQVRKYNFYGCYSYEGECIVPVRFNSDEIISMST